MDRLRPIHSVSLRDVFFSSTSWRIKCFKLFDWFIGRLLLLFIRPHPPSAVPIVDKQVKRILVIRPGGIGDAVLLLPMLRELKAKFTQAAIDVLAEKRNVEIFMASAGIVNECYSYYQYPVRVFKELARVSYDIIFDTEQWHQLNAIIAKMLGASVCVGFNTNPWRNRCYTVQVSYRHEDFEGESFLRMLQSVTGQEVKIDWDDPFLELSNEYGRWAAELVGQRRVISVALRGGIRERCWEPEKFQDLCRRILDEGLDVCFLGGRQDAVLAAAIQKTLPSSRSINLAGQTSLLQSAAVLNRSLLFVGTDSGLMHLAYAVGTPIVALFGSGIEDKWAPRGKEVRILNRHLPCSPCTRFGYTPRCPIGVQCLKDISVEEVFNAAAELLGRSG